MQKPLQNIYTAALFVSFVILIVFGGVQAVSMLAQSGLERAAASPAYITVDDMDTLDEGVFAADEVSVKECVVVYHHASQDTVYRGGYLYPVADEDPDDTGILYYALYTCSGAVVIAEGYI